MSNYNGCFCEVPKITRFLWFQKCLTKYFNRSNSHNEIGTSILNNEQKFEKNIRYFTLKFLREYVAIIINQNQVCIRGNIDKSQKYQDIFEFGSTYPNILPNLTVQIKLGPLSQLLSKIRLIDQKLLLLRSQKYFHWNLRPQISLFLSLIVSSELFDFSQGI